MYPIPHPPALMSSELAQTGVTILPMAIAAGTLLLTGLVLIRVFSRRNR